MHRGGGPGDRAAPASATYDGDDMTTTQPSGAIPSRPARLRDVPSGTVGS
jgi:hypothetical protein